MTQRKAALLGLGLAVGGLGFALVLRQVDLAALKESLQDADYRILLLYAPLFFVDMALRAWRWTMLFPAHDKPGVFDAYNAMVLGNAINIFTPARGGDVARAVALGLKAERSKSEALATVLVDRVADVAFACLLMAAISPFVPFDPVMRKGVLLLGAGVFGGVACIAALGLLGKERLVAFFLPAFLPAWLRNRLEPLLWGFVYGVQRMGSRRTVLPFFAASAGIWLLEIACLTVVVRALGMDFSFVAAAGLLLFAVFGSMVPGPPGQVGVFEYAVTTGAAMLGFEHGAALAILWHGLALVLAGVAGLVASCVVKRTPGESSGQS